MRCLLGEVCPTILRQSLRALGHLVIMRGIDLYKATTWKAGVLEYTGGQCSERCSASHPCQSPRAPKLTLQRITETDVVIIQKNALCIEAWPRKLEVVIQEYW